MAKSRAANPAPAWACTSLGLPLPVTMQLFATGRADKIDPKALPGVDGQR